MSEPTHAGAVVVRAGPAGPEYLVVRARSERPEWVLPKGHIDPGETPEAAALRELQEEAGVEGEIVAPVGRTAFQSRDGPASAVYYLVRYLRTVPAAEEREVRWCDYERARALLTFEDTKDVLERASTRLSLLES